MDGAFECLGFSCVCVCVFNQFRFCYCVTLLVVRVLLGLFSLSHSTLMYLSCPSFTVC